MFRRSHKMHFQAFSVSPFSKTLLLLRHQTKGIIDHVQYEGLPLYESLVCCPSKRPSQGFRQKIITGGLKMKILGTLKWLILLLNALKFHLKLVKVILKIFIKVRKKISKKLKLMGEFPPCQVDAGELARSCDEVDCHSEQKKQQLEHGASDICILIGAPFCSH
jgi:hypothetical protein